ncbi:NHL repeat-containing protein [Candidatus Dependentiae bacterium]|nr:NHL repeat-containing protein [Candidatus Dependentiae bacterium]
MRRLLVFVFILSIVILSSCVKPETFVPVLTSASFDLEFVTSYGSITGFWLDAAVPDSNGNVYHVTHRTLQVYVYDENDTLLDQWGTPGAGDGELLDTDGMTLDKNDNVYISDGDSDKVQKFTSDGTYLLKFTHPNLDSPGDLTVDKQGNLFVASKKTDSIVKFDKTGNYLTHWGGAGTGNGKFNSISYITVDPDGNLFVSDIGNDCVQKFDSNGNFLMKFGKSGTEEGEFTAPGDIAFDKYGYIYVTAIERGKIMKFSGGGVFLQEFGTKGITEEYEFGTPWQLYISDNFTFMVVDGSFENHIKIFDLVTE